MGYGIVLSADNVDFMVHGIFQYSFFGHQVWITTTQVCLLIVVLGLTIFALVVNHKMKKATEVPKGLQNVVEMLIDFLDGMIKGTMGKHAKVFRNYIGTIAIFILVSNISGLIGLRPPTADYGVTFPMGVTTFLIVHFLEFKHHKPLELWAAKCSPLPPWLPVWLPVTLIGDFAVPISLSLRLFANVLSGTVMMSLIYGLLRYLAVGWPAALHVYFDIFSGAIQTYVFCMLTMTYITDAYGDET
ncbi:MAG: F0F1 ATP synthase subunit A [Lachnospiraceae bacterium]|jgi:F-type H+-transporting ATPase subunit a|nr:F0F1 ATP synthase subunit A [Lachnospiraceae bacterium]MBO4807780.1 F0F1 ATP synthase subunit A [Lachnospiraceae bacterium]SDA78134.1 F-type H+-transporting ATPase subunit a [Lachnospiraceae bacterium G11]